MDQIIGCETFLTIGCRQGFVEGVRALLESGADPNLLSPIEVAINSNHSEIVKLLIEYGANVNNELLSHAVRSCSLGSVKVLLEYGVLNHLIEKKFTENPLSIASKLNNYDIAKLLIENNIDVNQPDSEGNTPLVFACKEHNSLINEGNTHSGLDQSEALALTGNIQLIKLLIDHGADVNFANDKGNTALIYICKHQYPRTGYIDGINILLDSGADVNFANDEENTALMYICKYPYTCKEYIDGINILLDSGANVNYQNKNGHSALLFACKYPSTYKPDIIKILLEKNADPNCIGADELTPLRCVIESSKCNRYINEISESIKLLIQYGADIDHVNSQGETILMYAVKFCVYSVVKLLIELGANKFLKNREGLTVYEMLILGDIPESANHDKIIDLLKIY